MIVIILQTCRMTSRLDNKTILNLVFFRRLVGQTNDNLEDDLMEAAKSLVDAARIILNEWDRPRNG
jgi:hypothetical protein